MENLKERVLFPGLTPDMQEIEALAGELPKQSSIFFYQHEMPYLWVAFIGGTGTGKSAIFNAFCGQPLSESGIERPKTSGPIAYAHKDAPIEIRFPIRSVRIDRKASHDDDFIPSTGKPQHLLVLEHQKEELSHLILIDTPDLDSVAVENRRIAEDLYLLSDGIVFVTSQEKYADDVPSQFFRKVIEEKKPYFFLLNKVQHSMTEEDLLGTFQKQHIIFSKDRIWPVFHVPSPVLEGISSQPTFQDFIHRIRQEFSPSQIPNLKKKQHAIRAKDLKRRINRLLNLLEEEKRACDDWLRRLHSFYEQTTTDLIEDEKERFTDKSREYLRTEIRGLFHKYDVLAKPRRLLKDAVLFPFRLFGLVSESTPRKQQEALRRIRRKIDQAPLLRALEKLNRSVFEKLSPENERSPLFKELRRPGVVLQDSEVQALIREKQDELGKWLEETVKKLSEGLPRSKRWGIYSTSIIWGILILSLEAAVGGGFTMLDMALDSALAPMVTKGAVELFAYHEIQNIAKELAKRYQEGLLLPLSRQRDRYEKSLQSLMTPQETLDSLVVLLQRIDDDPGT